jgi:ABC-type oligopeptide transport system substrate-binding subunit
MPPMAARFLRSTTPLLLLSLAAAPSAASAQTSPSLSGDYLCAYGCRLSDVNPSVAVDGVVATCVNEFGGLFRGRVLSETSISCFNKIGVLASDGITLNWSDGVIWKRHLGSAD